VTQSLIRAAAVCFLMSFAAGAHAQTQPASAAPQTGPASPKLTIDLNRVLPVRVLVTVSRYQGDKRISSMPYTVSVNGAQRGVGQIRIGAEVPITTGVTAASDGKQAPPALSYEHLGTQIDCRVSPTDDGRYAVELTVAEKSLYPDGEGPNVARPSGNPPFRSFRTSNVMVLRDGQSAEFAAAGDRLTGEIIRVEATLHIVK
jgi:hypothetical protein